MTNSNNVKSVLIIFWVVILSFLHIRQDDQINELRQTAQRQDSLFKDMYYGIFDTLEAKAFIVTVTTYHPVKWQCDDSPDRTSCNLKIDINNPYKHRYIGLSRDLLDHFYYGEKVILENCGKYSGEYIVADCGNRRLIRTVDILIGRNMVGGRFENAVIRHKN